jgi:hypothetical protein
MNVEELIERLNEFDPAAPVRFASQPNWPLEYDIDNVVCVDLSDEENDEELQEILSDDSLSPEEREEEIADARARRRDEGLTNTVYLIEGRQIGYLEHAVAVEAGWK